ncbi:MAG TPA: asparagine synthase (glutamine-hydrolyzing), partial [Desulfobacterales bacterium]|nr:asparagine synthase (glutamine-hydrolyzing) [Desulfobacterales bacterium]
MCGICGIVNLDRENHVKYTQIKRMCDALVHRGPDDDGIFVKDNVGIGMRRLSIIDLVTGNQPISNEDDTIRVVFNGEIYNYLDLRQALRKKGHRFSTNSDTEVIVHAYEEYGEDCPAMFNGMFAFAIWDDHRKRLFVARDRIGIKPLYYYKDDKRVVFGSEPKAILQTPDVPREIDPLALDNFLTFEYIPAPLSIFRDIKKLYPAHTLSLHNGAISTKRYWHLPVKHCAVSKDEICNLIRDYL